VNRRGGFRYRSKRSVVSSQLDAAQELRFAATTSFSPSTPPDQGQQLTRRCPHARNNQPGFAMQVCGRANLTADRARSSMRSAIRAATPGHPFGTSLRRWHRDQAARSVRASVVLGALSSRNTSTPEHVRPQDPVVWRQYLQLFEDFTSELHIAQPARGDQLSIAHGWHIHVVHRFGVMRNS
jgi:hypothetical protein